jgi:1,4-dihydroxy-6-naphthoate synthase
MEQSQMTAFATTSLRKTTSLPTASPPARPAPVGTLRVAYTPDSDDAFNFYAWEHDRVGLPGFEAAFHRDHIIALNRAAEAGTFDVVGVSSAIYPRVSDRYAILAVGTSVGRGYGPVLVSRDYRTLTDLHGKRIAVGGLPTTGAALAMMFCPGATFIEHRYDRIADAIVAGEFDAGVMIHEELLFFPEKGLHAVADLGKAWCDDTGLPLPVGLNLVSRRLDPAARRDVAGTCRRSLEWAQAHFDEAFAFACTFGRGCARQHVTMFSNADTICMPADVRRALRVMFDRVAALGIGPRVGEIEVVDV